MPVIKKQQILAPKRTFGALILFFTATLLASAAENGKTSVQGPLYTVRTQICAQKEVVSPELALIARGVCSEAPDAKGLLAQILSPTNVRFLVGPRVVYEWRASGDLKLEAAQPQDDYCAQNDDTAAAAAADAATTAEEGLPNANVREAYTLRASEESILFVQLTPKFNAKNLAGEYTITNTCDPNLCPKTCTQQSSNMCFTCPNENQIVKIVDIFNSDVQYTFEADNTLIQMVFTVYRYEDYTESSLKQVKSGQSSYVMIQFCPENNGEICEYDVKNMNLLVRKVFIEYPSSERYDYDGCAYGLTRIIDNGQLTPYQNTLLSLEMSIGVGTGIVLSLVLLFFMAFWQRRDGQIKATTYDFVLQGE